MEIWITLGSLFITGLLGYGAMRNQVKTNTENIIKETHHRERNSTELWGAVTTSKEDISEVAASVARIEGYMEAVKGYTEIIAKNGGKK